MFEGHPQCHGAAAAKAGDKDAGRVDMKPLRRRVDGRQEISLHRRPPAPVLGGRAAEEIDRAAHQLIAFDPGDPVDAGILAR